MAWIASSNLATSCCCCQDSAAAPDGSTRRLRPTAFHAARVGGWRLPLTRLPKPSWVEISQVRTLSTQRLGARIGRLAEHDLAHLVDGLLELIG